MTLLFLLLLHPSDTLIRDTIDIDEYRIKIVVTNTLTGKSDTTTTRINKHGSFLAITPKKWKRLQRKKKRGKL